MNALNDYLIQGFNYELTHQLILKMLLEEKSFLDRALEELNLEKINNPIIDLEPKEGGIRFDLGIRSNESKEYSILVELKMWSPTGKNQLEEQIEVANRNDKTLIYIIIGYPDKKLSDRKKKKKNCTEFIYIDTNSIIEFLKKFDDLTTAITYYSVLKSQLIDSYFNNENSEQNNHLPYFYSLQNHFRDLLDTKVKTDIFCSNAGQSGKNLRCYAQLANPVIYNEGKFDIYLFLMDNMVRVELYDYRKNDKENQKDLYEKLFMAIEDLDGVQKTKSRFSKYRTVTEYTIDDGSFKNIDKSVKNFELLHAKIIQFQNKFKDKTKENI